MSSKGKRGGRKAKVKQQEPAATAPEGGGDPNESLAADFEMVGLDVLSWMNDTVNFESTGWSRTAPSQQQLRDQNKQLRLVIPEDDPQHTQDARTVEELRERRQAAIKIRNQQLLGALKKLHSSRHVDLCFVIDATCSMERHIKGVKDAIRGIVDSLAAKDAVGHSGAKAMVNTLRLGFVAYRDFDYTTRFEVLPFTQSVEEFHEFCSKVETQQSPGGNDTPEDVLGGLDKALSLEWSSEDNTTVIFHICDQPAHGKQFHNANDNLLDNYPDGDPTGLDAKEIFKRIADRGIDYSFGKITERTKTMVKAFSDALGDPIDQFDIKNVCDISNSVIAAVSKSVGNALSKVGPSARPEVAYRPDPSIPTSWDAHKVQNGRFLAYEFPESIEDVANGVPLVHGRPEIASLQIAAHPFARGGERIAYYGRDLKTNEDVVLKEYRFITSATVAGLRHEIANQLQTVASYFAAHFMDACQQKMPAEKIPAVLHFLMTKTLAIGSAANVRYMSCEPRLDSNRR
ncbi:Efk-1 [Aphelenchoides fujianensis]|nr:Efk-1 [Aphelenchoides fujianensis]